MPESPLTVSNDTITGWRVRAAQGSSFCALLPGAVDTGGTTSHFLPLALVLAAFTGAAVWMFRRWGTQREPEPQTVPERTPASEPQPTPV